MIELEVILRLDPLAYFILKALDIRVVDSPISAMVGGKYLYIGSKFWEFSFEKRVFVLIHEAYHKLLRHDRRAYFYSGSPEAFNIGADAKVNYLIFQNHPGARRYLIDWSRFVPENVIAKLSAEDLARIFEKRYGSRFQHYNVHQKFFDADLEPIDPLDDIDLNFAISMGSVFSKGKGTELRKVIPRPISIDWVSLLSDIIMSSEYYFDWYRYNKRTGTFGITAPSEMSRVALIDVSASISDMELSFFFDALATLEFATAIFFDDGVQMVLDELNISPYKVKGLRGKGGTRISEALKYALKLDPDILLLFTDGYIDDWNSASQLLTRLNASKILITVDKKLNGFDHIIDLGAYDL